MALENTVQRYGVIVLLMGALAACATDPAASERAAAKRPTQDDPEKGIICTNERPTGSFIREKKCTTPEERELARRDTEHRMVVEPGSAAGP